MKQIVDTLTHLSTLDPPTLPAAHVPGLPDVSALLPLAEAMSADPATLTTVLGAHDGQRGVLNALLTKASPAIDAARQDLVGIGVTLLAQSLPVAASAMTLNPAAAAAAHARLTQLAGQALTEALERLSRLEQELVPLATGLEEIAAAPDPRLTVTEQMAGPAGERPAAPAAQSAEDAVASEEIDSGPDSMAGQAAVDAALSQVGTPYVWGGTTPAGFDCSGFVQWAYQQAGVELPRTAEEQAIGQSVAAEQLQPGDLAVWDGHVAMYIGDGMMVEAGDPVQTNPVRTSNIGMDFKGFWRPTA